MVVLVKGGGDCEGGAPIHRMRRCRFVPVIVDVLSPVPVAVAVTVTNLLLLTFFLMFLIASVYVLVGMWMRMSVTVVVFVPRRRSVVMMVVMSMRVPASAEIAKGAERDPQTESDQCQARDRGDGIGKPGRQRGPGEPNDEADHQC